MEDSHKPRRFSYKPLLIAGIAVALTVAGITVFLNTSAGSNLLSSLTGKEQTIHLPTILKQIRKHTTLPDEEPTLAVVSDTSHLEGQPFFRNAENGDYVLVFQKSGTALLYRPSTNKVVHAAQVSFSDPTQPLPISNRELQPDETVVLGAQTEAEIEAE